MPRLEHSAPQEMRHVERSHQGKMPTVTWGLNVEVILSISSVKSGTISVMIIVPSPVSADI